MDLTTTRVLTLNRSYYPIGLCTVRDAFKLICQPADESDPGKGPLAWILDAKAQPYDLETWMSLEVEEGMESIGLPGRRIRVPRVIRLATFNKVPNTIVRFSRQNVVTRDSFVCQYCGKKKHISNLSLDHVHPRSRGGKTEWKNIATACTTCNSVKADRTPEEAGMKLLRKPFRPTWDQLQMAAASRKMYPEWENFLVKK